MLRIVAYSNVELFFFVKQHRTATGRRDEVFYLSTLGSLTSAPGMNIREAAAVKNRLYGSLHTACLWCCLKDCHGNKKCDRLWGDPPQLQALPFWQPDEDITATPCTTTTTTGGKIWSDNVNCCVAQMFISKLVKHPGIFSPLHSGTILHSDFLCWDSYFPQEKIHW